MRVKQSVVAFSISLILARLEIDLSVVDDRYRVSAMMHSCSWSASSLFKNDNSRRLLISLMCLSILVTSLLWRFFSTILAHVHLVLEQSMKLKEAIVTRLVEKNGFSHCSWRRLDRKDVRNINKMKRNLRRDNSRCGHQGWQVRQAKHSVRPISRSLRTKQRCWMLSRWRLVVSLRKLVWICTKLQNKLLVFFVGRFLLLVCGLLSNGFLILLPVEFSFFAFEFVNGRSYGAANFAVVSTRQFWICAWRLKRTIMSERTEKSKKEMKRRIERMKKFNKSTRTIGKEKRTHEYTPWKK